MKMNFEHIVADLKGTASYPVIDELLAHLVAAGALPAAAKEPIAQAIKQREQSMSTGIGLGVAIPHAATPLIPEPILVFGRSRAGVDFDALDRQPVRLVVLALVPNGEKEKHLKLLAAVSRLLRKPELRGALETAADDEAIFNVLNNRALTAV